MLALVLTCLLPPSPARPSFPPPLPPRGFSLATEQFRAARGPFEAWDLILEEGLAPDPRPATRSIRLLIRATPLKPRREPLTLQGRDLEDMLRALDLMAAAANVPLDERIRTWTQVSEGGLRVEQRLGRDRNGGSFQSVVVELLDAYGEVCQRVEGRTELVQQLLEVLRGSGN